MLYFSLRIVFFLFFREDATRSMLVNKITTIMQTTIIITTITIIMQIIIMQMVVTIW